MPWGFHSFLSGDSSCIGFGLEFGQILLASEVSWYHISHMPYVLNGFYGFWLVLPLIVATLGVGAMQEGAYSPL